MSFPLKMSIISFTHIQLNRTKDFHEGLGWPPHQHTACNSGIWTTAT